MAKVFFFLIQCAWAELRAVSFLHFFFICSKRHFTVVNRFHLWGEVVVDHLKGVWSYEAKNSGCFFQKETWHLKDNLFWPRNRTKHQCPFQSSCSIKWTNQEVHAPFEVASNISPNKRVYLLPTGFHWSRLLFVPPLDFDVLAQRWKCFNMKGCGTLLTFTPLSTTFWTSTMN